MSPVSGGPSGHSGNAFPEVQHIVHAIRLARSADDVASLMAEATETLDFCHFALASGPGYRAPRAVRPITNYPSEWVQMLGTTGYWLHDPAFAASQRTFTPFEWADLPQLIDFTPCHQAYMQMATRQGMHRGWTVPIHIPGEGTGLCSFVVTGNRMLPRRNLPAAQYLACFAFEAARRMAAHERGTPRLTKRQIECTILAARGKSDWVAGQILGLAPDTVHKYLEQAKARFGVSSRTELVVRALHDGQIDFSDLID